MVKIRSPREIKETLDSWIDEGRKLLPSFRGGSDPNPQRPPKPRKPQPLPKTFQFTPTIPSTPGPTGEDVRWKPTTILAPQPQEMIEMDAQEALTEVINNPAIEISPEMIEIINSPAFMMDRNGQVARSNQFGNQFGQQRTIPRKKRKVSAYSKRFGLELKKLKKLHPRTKVQDLMKRAHRATKRAMK